MEHGNLVGHLILILWGFAFGIPFVAMNSFTARLTLGGWASGTRVRGMD